MNNEIKTIIRRRGIIIFEIREIMRYRELLYFFVWKDIKVKYKQTIFGILWAIIQPFFTMVVFTIFFGKLGKIPSDDLPYPIFSFSALVPWIFFANSLSFASNSLVSQAHIITKVYLPRIILPLSSSIACLVDFFISFIILILMMFYYHIYPTMNLIFLPIFILLIITTSLGVSFFLSALNVEFRDVKYAIPFFIQFWLFITPIAYPSSMLKEPFRTIYGINPMSGVIEGFRWALLGIEKRPGPIMFLSGGISIIIFFIGLFYFRSMERKFADIV